MDILITFVIILVICLAVAPFFLLSGEFGAKSKARDDGKGLVDSIRKEKRALTDRDEGPDATDGTP